MVLLVRVIKKMLITLVTLVITELNLKFKSDRIQLGKEKRMQVLQGGTIVAKSQAFFGWAASVSYFSKVTSECAGVEH